MAKYYVTDFISTDPDTGGFAPYAGQFVDEWAIDDGRTDPTKPSGSCLFWCNPTPEQHAAIIADAKNEYIGES